ncbi:MAG: hypothetical protein QOE61_1475 [Micromonosporaceae bacterium]|nr:hypothetical protein [Micromonosporaceae bacterium]
MTSTDPIHVDDLARRRAAARRTTLLLLLEEWGPGYHRVTGNGVRYVAEIADATPEERDWLAQYTTEHPEVWQEKILLNPPEWHRLRQQQGQLRHEEATVAFRAGDYATARDRLDDALAYGAVHDGEWVRLHALIDRTEADAGRRAAARSDGGEQ